MRTMTAHLCVRRDPRSLPVLVGAALLQVAGAAQAGDVELARGAAAIEPFKRELQQALLDGLSEGAVEAVGVCRLEAPKIALAYSREGVRVGRTSHRLRNRANAAPAWVQPILDEYRKDASSRSPRDVMLPNGRVGYTEPIVAKPLCLTCHGQSLDPAVAARIEELYPDDRAVGFAAGDLRGVFWAELPAEP